MTADIQPKSGETCARCQHGEYVRIQHRQTFALPECWFWTCTYCDWRSDSE